MYEDAKKFLKSPSDYKKRMDFLLDEIEETRLKATGIYNTKDAVSRSSNRLTESPQARMMSKLIRLEDEYNNAAADYLLIKHEVCGFIRSCSELHSAILYKKYIQGKTLAVIAQELDYHPGTIRHKHGDALDEAEQRLKQPDPESQHQLMLKNDLMSQFRTV